MDEDQVYRRKVEKAASIFSRLDPNEIKQLRSRQVEDVKQHESIRDLLMQRSTKEGHTGPLAQEAVNRISAILAAIMEDDNEE